MLEAASVPLLVAAVNFLFGEASKILQERRERKKEAQEQEGGVVPSSRSVPVTESQNNEQRSGLDAISTREEGLRQEVNEAALSANEAEIRHLLSLLEIQSRSYRLAKEQYAIWGRGLVPPIVVHNLEEAESGVADTATKLQTKLKAVYGRPVTVPGLEESGS
jgi:hypothetical protein